jgi:hypothetical protein
MINMRIPPKLSGSPAIDLSSATQQVQFFIENGQIVPKQTDLIWSRGVLIFYVDRRATTIKLNDQLSQFSMTKLPQPIAGFEKLNNAPVKFTEAMHIRDEAYVLKSVVFSEVNVEEKAGVAVETDVVIGSSAIVLRPKSENADITCGGKKGQALADFINSPQNTYETVPIIYDPYSPVLVNNTDLSKGRGPMHKLNRNGANKESSLDEKNTSFPYLCKHRGTIFVYKSVSQDDNEKEIGL